MTEDLESAAAKVEQHLRGGELSENKVLAAYLRERGHAPNGEIWTRAKEFLALGHTFASAAEAAERAIQGSGPAIADAPPANRTQDRTGSNDDRADDLNAMSSAGDRSTDARGGGTPDIDPAVWDVERLYWYPKRYSPGDIDGDGAKKLLGTPSIPLASVLVRETAQNSWDARTGDSDVEFALNMRLLSSEQTRILREICLREEADEVDIYESLDKPIWVLEISDRGTHGLRGPTRNDLEVAAGESTNFIDLVFNLGGKHDVDRAGGTYGFGKTVAYKASRLGTVLMWSRIRVGAQFEDRMIGSSIGDRFNMDGFRYTGRHWWGRMEDETVQPLRGANARALGGALYSRGFVGDETGTSILVLIPELGGDSPIEDANRLAEAARWHLWPKMLEAQSDDVRLKIDVQIDGKSIPIRPPAGTNPVIDSLATCLRAVRAIQSGNDVPDAFPPIQVDEVWCQRPNRLVGHVAFQRFQAGRFDTLAEDILPFERPTPDQPVRYVALMRNEAELVVKYVSGPPIEVAGFGWVGAFKPTAAMDKVFAASEPPAHDDWVPEGVGDRQGATLVRVGQRRIRELAQAFAQPLDQTTTEQRSAQSVAGLADALADLIPQVLGSRPEPRVSSKSGLTGPKVRPRVDITNQILGPARHDGTRLIALEVAVVGADLPAVVGAKPSIGVEGGSDEAAGAVSVVGWQDQQPAFADDIDDLAHGDTYETDSGRGWCVLQAAIDVALDVEIGVLQ